MNNWPNFPDYFSQQSLWKEVVQQSRSTKDQIEQLDKITMNHKDLFPTCDLYQKEDSLFLDVELAGLTKDDIHVTLKNGLIVLEGTYQTFIPGSHYFIKERVSKKFSKEIPLPFPVNQAKISYTFQNGLLNIILPIESDNENPIPISF